MKRLALIPLLLLAGCYSFRAPTVTVQPNSCVTLIPENWRAGVIGAPLPEDDTIGAWVSFGDAQTGKLDQANGRTKDSIEIVERCEARDKAAVKRATRGFFGRLFGG